MKNKLIYYSNPTKDDFLDLWMSFKPRRGDLVINGIDFNEKLDIARIQLHARIGGWNPKLIMEFFNLTGTWIYPPYGHEMIMENYWEKRGMEVAWPKHPFILSDPQA